MSLDLVAGLLQLHEPVRRQPEPVEPARLRLGRVGVGTPAVPGVLPAVAELVRARERPAGVVERQLRLAPLLALLGFERRGLARQRSLHRRDLGVGERRDQRVAFRLERHDAQARPPLALERRFVGTRRHAGQYQQSGSRMLFA